MISLARILLPVDFSERSIAAAHWAKELATHFTSELIALHAIAPPQTEFGATELSGSMLAELCENHTAQATAALESFVETHLPGMNIRREVLYGDPATVIVDYSQARRIGLIVMPTHGYGPFRRFILGSITAKVLHDADCPVWTGAHLEQAQTALAMPFRRVLCAVDLGPQSAQALCWAATLAREFSAELSLYHVTACDPNLRSAAGEELQRLRTSVGATAQLEIESGEPSRLICAAAGRLQSDVLVIGRGSAAGVFGRLRTNAYAVIRESPCPVVSV